MDCIFVVVLFLLLALLSNPLFCFKNRLFFYVTSKQSEIKVKSLKNNVLLLFFKETLKGLLAL